MTQQIALQEMSSGKTYTVNLPCVIGRGKDADLVFSDPSISHRHALILEADGAMWVEDLKSANGVYINDRKIDGRSLLQPGDSIQVGQTKFLIIRPEEDFSAQTVVLHSLDAKAEQQLDHRRLKLIHEIAAELAGNQDYVALAEKMFGQLKEIFQQDRGYLALFQADGTLKPLFADFSMESLPLSRSIINRVFQNGEALLLEDALSEAPLKEQESILALNIRSALCVPLIHRSQIYGLIYLDRNIPGYYQQDDLEFLRSIAFLLAPLIENARLWSELKNRYANAMETLRRDPVAVD